MRAVVEGLVAGWAIAIPVGAIGVLIVDRAATRGFGIGAAAALGTASADLFYAAAAVVLGGAAAEFTPDHPAVPALSAVVLAAVAFVMLRNAMRNPGGAPPPRSGGHGGTVATFFAMTVINPVTVLYFAALVTGLDDTVLGSTWQRAAFAFAAFAASLSWQLALAGFGATVGSRLSPTATRALRVVGAVVVLGFAVRIGLRALG